MYCTVTHTCVTNIRKVLKYKVLGYAPYSLNLSTPRGFRMFQFQDDLLPLSLSEAERPEDGFSEKTLGLVKGIALVAGLQIGSGIFSSPGVVLANTQSVGASLVVWFVSGILAWTGASSFAELGTAIPINGGAQAYLAYAYHPLVAYLFAWTCISVLKPGGNAIISLIFGEYMGRLFFNATSSEAAPGAIPDWSIKLTACIAVVLISLLNASTPKLGPRAAVMFTVVKVAALLSVSILGIIQVARGRSSTSLREPLFSGTTENISSYALALYSGLWAFDGWDQTNYVAGEMKNPAKNLPRVIHISMTVVMILFLSANLSYFVLLDRETVAKSNTIALDFGHALFGRVGGIVFACMVAFSCIGALNGSFFTTARLIYMAGKERFLPSIFGRLHQGRKTPINAIILQASLTIFFIMVGGGFRTLVNFVSVALWGFYFLTVLGLVVLRIKEPNLERPYKTWIATPLIFCAVALFLLSMPVVAAPLEALSAIGFIAFGIPLYFITQNSSLRKTGESRMESVLAWIMTYSPFSRSQRLGAGWVAVSTDAGDEHVEMLQPRHDPTG
ncbi:amino acid permease-domain-containing protein [Hysterangium stoloniferum]|nr:amino acid permease-domain-containing protein [Hysterangium stoloniferum]